MKPIIILPPNTVSAEDIQVLRDNDLCVVVAENPAAVKFVDTIPAITSRTAVEEAAIQLSRKILTPGTYGDESRRGFAALFIDILMKGTPLDPRPSQREQEERLFTEEKHAEIQRLARQEAREERAAKRAALAAKKLAEKK